MIVALSFRYYFFTVMGIYFFESLYLHPLLFFAYANCYFFEFLTIKILNV